MTTEQAFLDAIRADPDDDTLRLVFADWLDEHGNAAECARAELIRVQCELARWVPDLRRRTALHSREAALLQAHAQHWLGRDWDWPAQRKFARIRNSSDMDLTFIPAGTFLMGSPETEVNRASDEGPLHEVTISRPFYLGVYAVTQHQFQRVTGRNPAHFHREHRGSLLHPVETLSWSEAVEFCQVLSALPAETEAGRVYRLPTEAEWEHACRAGRTTPFAFGPQLSSQQANFDGRYGYGGAPEGLFLDGTARVGSYPANAFGLFDMHGNVWEWCSDWYQPDYYAKSPALDPQGPDSGPRRSLRGGSWYLNGMHCRSAYRNNNVAPETRDCYYGFRVAMEGIGGG